MDKVKIQVSIDKYLWDEFKDLCRCSGIRQSAFLEYILRDFMNKGGIKYEYKRE